MMIKRIVIFTSLMVIGLSVLFASSPSTYLLEDHTLYYQKSWYQKVLLENIVDYTLTDLKNIGECLLVIESLEDQSIDQITYGNMIKFYTIDPNKKSSLSLAYENDFTKVKPWAIDAADMDGDQENEVYIGAYRATDYYDADKRPFFFDWNGEFLTRKWTGSYISFDKLINLSFEDLEGDGSHEIKTLEQLADDTFINRYYKWGYFNFTIIKESILDE